PALCCAYLAYDRYAGPTWRHLGPRVAFAAVVVVLPLNVVLGLQFRDWYHQLVDPFANDVKAGVPFSQLLDYGSIGDAPEWGAGMVELHHARVGIFSQLRLDDPAPPPGQRIDGLAGDGAG